VNSAPVFRYSPYSRSDLHRYDSLESMFVTIMRLIEVGVYESENGGMVVKAGCNDVIDRISADVNPNAVYWRRRLEGIYE